ncbi:TolB family protein [Nonomuraea sp. NPDC047897]|uniref:TolB family protein n=1 Tax=Nonomuraea sp. NPDC047897 TaxID=3364346 RepID=UPI0037114C1D
MNDLENRLSRTLTGAAGRAPHAPGTLARAVEARYRRRRQRGRALLAAAAVVVLAGGTSHALLGEDVRAVPATSATTAATSDEARLMALPEPIERAWPGAVRKIPARMPDGRAFQPLAFLDERTLLVTTQQRSEVADAVHAYDLESGDLRKIANVPTSEGAALFSSGFTVGAGQVVWWTNLEDGRTQIWSVPLAGGEARVVDTIERSGPDTQGVDGLAVTGDRVVFSVNAGGVFAVPLGGGTAKPVEGGAGLHLLSWPWAGTVDMRGPQEPQFGTIRNLETGETRTALVRPGEKEVTCGLTVCIGWAADGTAFHRSRDGSREKASPCGPSIPPGRFCATVVGSDRRPLGVALYDTTTGKAADLGIRPAEGSTATTGTATTKGTIGTGPRVIWTPRIEGDQPLLSYLVGDTRYVVDLRKIG